MKIRSIVKKKTY